MILKEVLNVAKKSHTTEDYKILYKYIKNKKPTVILEIGTGNSTLVIAQALKEISENNHFASVDIHKLIQDEISIKLQELNLSNANLILQDSCTFTNDNCPKESLDFIFLDSSHTFERTLLELNFLLPALKKDGYLFMHDTKMTTVLSAIYVILLNIPDLSFHEFNTYHGLGLLRRK